VRELQKHTRAAIVQIGTDHHLAMGSVKTPPLPGTASFVNQFTLEESCAAIAASRLFIGVDSGLLHVAAALRIPCVGVFGPTSPRLRLPSDDVANCVISHVPCQGCHHRLPRIHWETNCPYDIDCMKSISAASVLKACLPLLESQPN
jgi:heptosyltransferase-2